MKDRELYLTKYRNVSKVIEDFEWLLRFGNHPKEEKVLFAQAAAILVHRKNELEKILND